MKRKSLMILALIVFVVCLSLVIIGQKQVGLAGLGIQMIGLVGLLVLLFLYNRQYR